MNERKKVASLRQTTDGRSFSEMSDPELYSLLPGEKPIAEPAFAELYARHSPRVYAYCRTAFPNRDEAEDVYQEAFIRFFESAKVEKAMTNVPAYLLRITRNLCLNAKRDKRATVSIEDYQISVSDGSMEQREMHQLIAMAMELLPEDMREAFFLREYEDMTYDEIGKMLGSTAVTIRIRVHRARKRIREILHPYLAELSE